MLAGSLERLWLAVSRTKDLEQAGSSRAKKAPNVFFEWVRLD